MAQCPNCGAPAESWATVCEECGATLDDGRHDDQGGQQGQPQQGQNRQPRQGQGGQQSQGGQRGSRQGQSHQRSGSQQGYGHQKSRTVGERGGQSNAGDDSDGVGRRAVLAGVGGVAVLGAGGFLGYQEFVADGSGASSGPKSTARELVTAIGEQDAETARSLAHPDSPLDFSFDDSRDSSITINELREVDPATDRASTAVEVDMRVTAEADTDTATYRVELLQHDGEWKVWTAGLADRFTGDEGSGSTATQSPGPVVSFSFQWIEGEGSAGSLTVSHDGGDTLRAGALVFRGSNPAADNLGMTWDSYDSETGPDDDITAGDTIQLNPIATDAEVNLVWESDDASTTSTLGSWVGPDA